MTQTSEGYRVGILHHREFNEWRLPKGKLKPPETFEQAALREVEEELGTRAQILRELGASSYTYLEHGQPAAKQVRFYMMTCEAPTFAIEEKTFDAVAWLPFDEAAAKLTWDNEREMVKKAQQAV